MTTCQYTHLGYHCPLEGQTWKVGWTPPLAPNPPTHLQKLWRLDSLCVLHNPRGDKDEAAFLAALREKIRADSEDSNADAIHLEGMVVPGAFVWQEAVDGLEVKRDVRFSWAVFTEDADFSGATFTGDADFSWTYFTGDADFSWTYFTGATGFSWADFTGAAYFTGATFIRDADFSDASFAANAYFGRATFKQRLVIRPLISPEQQEEGAREGETAAPAPKVQSARAFALYFTSVVMEKPELVSFEDVDLSQASFLYTNLSKVRFIAVTWAKKTEPLWGIPLLKTAHFQIADHVRLDAGWDTLDAQQRQQQAALVADEYRQLRLNLEADHQEIEAGQFYIGQMDMRRRDDKVSGSERRFLAAYRLLAMYGESAWRPLGIYLLSSLLLAFFYLHAGFSWGDDKIRYVWDGSGWLLPGLGDYVRAWYEAFTAGSLLRGNVQTAAWWGAILLAFNMVWDIFLVSLFVIALRRHFHR